VAQNGKKRAYYKDSETDYQKSGGRPTKINPRREVHIHTSLLAYWITANLHTIFGWSRHKHEDAANHQYQDKHVDYSP
jgi:hypothetical protein